MLEWLLLVDYRLFLDMYRLEEQGTRRYLASHLVLPSSAGKRDLQCVWISLTCTLSGFSSLCIGGRSFDIVRYVISAICH
jgi:hypothetical protein